MSVDDAKAVIASHWPGAKPRHAMVCGSGWGEVGESFSVLGTIPFGEIPSLGASTVEGHAGQLLLAEVAGTEILIFQGRRHFYEGEGWDPVVAPVRIAKALALKRCFLPMQRVVSTNPFLQVI